MGDDEESYGVPFHMAKLFYDELHALRIAKANAWINQDYELTLDCFIQMIGYINFKLNPQEQNLLNSKLNTAERYKLIKARSKQQQSRVADGLLRDACIEIDRNLSMLMFKYNMLFPKQQVLGLDKINKRYNLNDQDEDDA